ncbi:hypothetical protein MRB53_002281 [Persea americana]|uniref:Uncharacterized protein n=1 Tax=Persea americana TaxID=3435 RepID=A0ACC2MUZ0_PERAE|nr:hypothetical protein MRB53_002281 [Persea americana]
MAGGGGMLDQDSTRVHDLGGHGLSAFWYVKLSYLLAVKHQGGCNFKWPLSCILVNPSDVIILEGILAFHDPRVRELMNVKIFVDTGFNLFKI